ARIAMNRCFAGVHYPVDQYAGDLLGDMLGGLVVHRVFGQTPFKAAAQAEAFTTGVGPDKTVEHYALASPLLTAPAALTGNAATDGLALLATLMRSEL
ncbi:MAG: hypothetical protein H7245_15890, partial [Candidatus Saccharibacteria bacterium]|nr:hypothetical protein [Pseudorhodobacter sp.]